MYSIIKCYLRHILAVCVVSLCVMTGTAASSVKLDVDWPQFMSKQDMVWETLPEYWYESAYMGNGMLGLMIYKEPGHSVGNRKLCSTRPSEGQERLVQHRTSADRTFCFASER